MAKRRLKIRPKTDLLSSPRLRPVSHPTCSERISGAGVGGNGVESDGNEYYERCYGMDVRWTGGQLVAHVLSQSLR
jgi:hypothetical protein